MERNYTGIVVIKKLKKKKKLGESLQLKNFL